jgi:hypothetical protein
MLGQVMTCPKKEVFMKEERERILKMLADGKITVDEAEKLLDALAGPSAKTQTAVAEPGGKKKIDFLYVKVISANDDNVDIRVPLNLLRAGIKLTALIPPQAMKHLDNALDAKGIPFDFRNIKPENIEELVQSLADMEVNVNSKNGDYVKVYCA